MQTLDNSVTVSGAKGLLGRWKMTSRPGEPATVPPLRSPLRTCVVRILAEKISGTPMGNMGDIVGAR